MGRMQFIASACLLVCFWISVSCRDPRKNPYDIDDYKTHPCLRTCKEGEKPKKCIYYFLVEHYTTMSAACYDCPSNKSHCALPQCITGNGLYRPVLSVNRMVPGPAIQVCHGDTIEVVVDNRMELGEGTTIHWHGLRQHGTPYMDGTSMITQCPITKWSKMTYSFKAADAGTHFWHSHAAIQRSDGLFGSMIIRQPISMDPHASLFDVDIPEHTIMLNDWSKRMSVESFVSLFHTEELPYASGILVNGRGRTNEGFKIPDEEFTVKAGLRYRFRIIFSGILNCPIYVRIDGHKLLMIATDGKDFEPVEVDSFRIYSGERYDFVLNTKGEQEPHSESYWMRFKGLDTCATSKIIQTAILRYSTDASQDPPVEVTYDNTVPGANEVTLNDQSGVSSQTNIQIVDLRSLKNDQHGEDRDLLEEPDKRFHIVLSQSALPDTRFLSPPYPGCPSAFPTHPRYDATETLSSSWTNISESEDAKEKCKNPTRRNNLQLNHITCRLPPAPPLTQYDDVDKKLLCNGVNIQSDCTKKICDCVHTLTVDKDDLVEFVLSTVRGSQKANAEHKAPLLVHPMHLHGHNVRVVTMLRLNNVSSMAEVQAMDKRGEIIRIRSRAPYKDTIPVTDRSIVIIRFRADNPGFWFFHCHIELHTELGMALVLQSGNVKDFPKPPRMFPKCYSWSEDDEPAGDDHVDLNSRSLPGGGEDNLGANKTERDFLDGESLMIVGVAALVCLAVPAVLLALLVYRQRRQNRAPYRRLKYCSARHAGPYRSTSTRDETNVDQPHAM
ncbi:laccase [Plakobranchus ocellatus]|uniref:Laccase n=1 Tax=Plakobranchus ocellatus TaxID=259542 RepID=A0AAV4DB89_9GAST|nr:laccase [Plakobranchus ocellatus]